MKLHSVIFCDDSDDDLGEFFRNLSEETQKLFHEKCSSNDIKHNCSVLLSDELDKESIVETMSKVNRNNNFCCCYLHGKTNEMLNAGETIISTTLNHYMFTNSFIYAFSCNNGDELADCLIDNGANTFIGYCDDARCPVDCDELTVNVVLTGISSFLSGCDALAMYESIKIEYDKLVRNDLLDPIQRGYYLHNRDSLVIKGNKDFNINQMVLED